MASPPSAYALEGWCLLLYLKKEEEEAKELVNLCKNIIVGCGERKYIKIYERGIYLKILVKYKKILRLGNEDIFYM